MADLAALRAEIDTDPLARGYAGKSDGWVADSITNTIDRVVSRATVSGAEILNATDDGEYGLLTAAQQSSWLALCGVDSINTASGVAKSLEASLFGGGTQTRANLLALKNSTVSRAAELGLGSVNVQDVTKARAL